MISMTAMARPSITPTVSSRARIYFSTNTASSHENASASAAGSFSGSVTMLVPTEEPPEQGFTTHGNPILSGTASPRRSVTPGGVGMPLLRKRILLSSLSIARALPR